MNEYLSELFLSTVGTDFTKESVQKGIAKCNEAFKLRKYQCNAVELMDFWDVVREFVEEDEVYRKFRLVQEAEDAFRKRK